MTMPLDRLAALAGRSWRVAPLPGGLTNTNVRVTTDDGVEPALDLVVRCSHAGADLLGIDRAAERDNTAAAASAGVGAPVVDYRPDLGMLVIGYLHATALTDGSFADEAVMARAAAAVRRLHAGPRFTGDFDMFARRAAYLSTISDRGLRLPADYTAYADAWEDVRRALAVSPPPTVPCNNDLLAANFLDDGERVWLIDYEYSGNNDPSFELGNTVAECGFTPEQRDAWVEAYVGSPTAADLARVRLQALCSCYGWSLWGFIQAALSPIEFDFWDWGMERFEKAQALFGAADFPTLLAEAAAGG
ncbi:Thiamine kinase [Nocardioides terrae]|uniref:Thiamine kinase n=1 Tax=Nocardioides terrae TaxID=574651 RepID=A0A1I1JNF1_9ACTN|nr:choline kinase family protein [Nocardioides terrae]SFC50064.1 Thiamine kinase [Nocardioides terrae]